MAISIIWERKRIGRPTLGASASLAISWVTWSGKIDSPTRGNIPIVCHVDKMQ